MTVQIRQATSADLNAFLELHAQVHDLHLARRPDQFRQTGAPLIEARFREWLASSSAKIWVAEVAARVVGYAVELHVSKPANPYCPERHVCDIEQIAVAPAQQRQGIATALMQAVVDSAHAAGLREIELNSWAFNQDAHRAFEAFGFRPKTLRFELKR